MLLEYDNKEKQMLTGLASTSLILLNWIRWSCEAKKKLARKITLVMVFWQGLRQRQKIHLRHGNDPSFDIMDGLMRMIDPIFKVMHDKGGCHGWSEKMDGLCAILRRSMQSFLINVHTE